MRTDPGRLEGFSDAVFAIAITLLVLDLKVPPLGEPGRLGKLLLDDWREYLAFLTSFGTIGLAWLYHHEFFTLINRVDRALLALNILLLLGVVIVPFPTAVAVADFLAVAPEAAALPQVVVREVPVVPEALVVAVLVVDLPVVRAVRDRLSDL